MLVINVKIYFSLFDSDTSKPVSDDAIVDINICITDVHRGRDSVQIREILIFSSKKSYRAVTDISDMHLKTNEKWLPFAFHPHRQQLDHQIHVIFYLYLLRMFGCLVVIVELKSFLPSLSKLIFQLSLSMVSM